MFNRKKAQIKVSSVIGVVKEVSEDIRNRYSARTEQEFDNEKKKLNDMRQELETNDRKMDDLKTNFKQNNVKISQQKLITEKQRAIVEKELAKLEELEQIEGEMEETNDQLQQEIQRRKEQQKKLQKNYNHFLEEVKRTEQELAATLEDKKIEEKAKKSFGFLAKRTQDVLNDNHEEQKDKFVLTVTGRIHESERLAEELRMKMHDIIDFANENDELDYISDIIMMKNTTIQFIYEDVFYFGKMKEVRGVYFFKVSTDKSYEKIYLHKREDNHDSDFKTQRMAEGKIAFCSERNHDIDEINEIAIEALKSLNYLEKRLKERKKKHDDIPTFKRVERKSIFQ